MTRRVGLFALLVALTTLSSCRAPSKPAPILPRRPPTVLPFVPTARWKAALAYPPSIKALTNVVFTLTITDVKTGKPAEATYPTLDLQMPSMSMPPNTVVLKEIRPGVYAGKGTFTMAGTWRIVGKANDVPGDEWHEAFGPVTVK